LNHSFNPSASTAEQETLMSNTSIQAAPPPPSGTPSPPVQRQPDWLRPVKKVGQALASLRLTVVLFVLSMFLVFTGTLAMRDSGLWAALYGYFRCWIAWIPLQVFVPFGQVFFGMPMNLRVPGGFYYPGGWLLGTALLINLVAAHAVRFKFLKRADRSFLLEKAEQEDSGAMAVLLPIAHFILYRIAWKRSGILMIHSGLIILMLGEFITGKFASEALMPIVIGESSNYLQNSDRVELAFLQDDPTDPDKERTIVVPDQMLRNGGTIDDAHLPFEVEIVQFMPNADVRRRVPGEETLATRGVGAEAVLEEIRQSVGADSEQKADRPGAYVKLSDKKSGASLGTYLLWVYLGEQEIGSGSDAFRIDLRNKRSYQPYRIYLEEFHHDVYPGTVIPKNFSSRVRVVPDEGESREVVIYMNNPLRYEGQTFYQSGTLEGDAGTVLQVVKNPGAEMPYIACALVCLGMIVHFGLHLGSFLQRRTVS
jgi:hypothetical protein